MNNSTKKEKAPCPARKNVKRNRFSESGRGNNKKTFQAKWTEWKLHLNSNRLNPRVSVRGMHEGRVRKIH